MGVSSTLCPASTNVPRDKRDLRREGNTCALRCLGSIWIGRWRRSSVAVCVLTLCAPFGNLAVMPLFVLVLFKQGVVEVMKLPLAPESAMAESVVNADTKTVDIPCCKLLDIYCVFILVSAIFQAGERGLKIAVVPPSLAAAVARSLCPSFLLVQSLLLWLHLHPCVQQ